MVAQVVERQHFVRPGQVPIPGRNSLFQIRIAVYLFSLCVGLSLWTCSRIMHAPSFLSNFLSSFNIVNIPVVIFQWTKKRKINPKRGRNFLKISCTGAIIFIKFGAVAYHRFLIMNPLEIKIAIRSARLSLEIGLKFNKSQFHLIFMDFAIKKNQLMYIIFYQTVLPGRHCRSLLGCHRCPSSTRKEILYASSSYTR